MILNLRNILQEKINKTIWNLECRFTYHDTKVAMYMNEYTRDLLKDITSRDLYMYPADESYNPNDGIYGVYQGVDIIIKNELKDFEIEITEKEN